MHPLTTFACKGAACVAGGAEPLLNLFSAQPD